MNILVCGGAGFMGSHAIKYFLSTYPEYNIVNFDLLTYAGNLDNLREVQDSPHYVFVQGDICDKEKLQRTIREYTIDTIINYAAETHVDRSIMGADAFLKTHIFGVHNLLEVTKQFGIKKFIHISTDEVFGSAPQGSFTESSTFAPNSPYAASKAGGDLLCRSYVTTYGTPVIVTHSCNFYGSHQYPEKFIPLFITNLLEGKKVPLYGDGKNVREWIHTSDHCRAIDMILHHGTPGEVYNIGSGEEKQNKEVVDGLLQLLGLGQEMVDYVADRPGHDRRYAIDCTKIKQELGWEAKKSFAKGLKETVEWYKQNDWWWKKLKGEEYQAYYSQQYHGGAKP